MPIILSRRKLDQAIENPQLDCNKGKFIAINKDNSCIAVDNRSGNAWKKVFTKSRDAIDWLNDKYQVRS